MKSSAVDEDGSRARRRIDPNKLRKTLEAKQDESVKEFCRTVQAIAKSMHNKNKQDTDLAELREHLTIAIKDMPLDLFERAGAYVWEYRDDIAKGNVDTFLKKDYKQEIADEVEDESEVEKVAGLIGKIKRTWRFFNQVEQQDMISKFQTLVKHYAAYEGSRRELAKLAEAAETQ